MGMRLFSYLIILLMLASPAFAADGEGNSFTREAVPVTPVTLQSQNLRITLWGIKPAGEAVIDLKALDFLDSTIGATVTCRAVSGTSTDVVARCADHAGDDLGLQLLNHGYVIVDRQQDTSSVPAYLEAQKSAHRNNEGIWRQVDLLDKSGVPVWMQIVLGVLPVAGLLIVAAIMYHRLNRLEQQQQEEHEDGRRKENQLLARERHVLVTTIEGELAENKNRVEAFLTIYGAMLDDLKNKNATPKYQQSGDIVQKHPSLSRAVFETSGGKFSLLDMKLATQLSKLYAALPKEQEYINIEPGVPLDTAVGLVEKVMREAEALLPPMNALITALHEFASQQHE